MVRPDTINEMLQLKDSGFGQPSPRHGLNLLYWFANDYVQIDPYGHMAPKTHPNTRVYGFHLFHNFEDEDLLPNQKLPYYEVGNLNTSGADSLPQYVRQDYTHLQDGSNKDRIIVRLKDGCLERVYITEHIDRTNFGQTHRISLGLIANIRSLTREEFLRQMGALPYNNPIRGNLQSYTSPPRDNSWWCTIL